MVFGGSKSKEVMIPVVGIFVEAGLTGAWDLQYLPKTTGVFAFIWPCCPPPKNTSLGKPVWRWLINVLSREWLRWARAVFRTVLLQLSAPPYHSALPLTCHHPAMWPAGWLRSMHTGIRVRNISTNIQTHTHTTTSTQHTHKHLHKHVSYIFKHLRIYSNTYTICIHI